LSTWKGRTPVLPFRYAALALYPLTKKLFQIN
jgi:hypothetical protein